MSSKTMITTRLNADQRSEMQAFLDDKEHSYDSHATKLLSMESPTLS